MEYHRIVATNLACLEGLALVFNWSNHLIRLAGMM